VIASLVAARGYRAGQWRRAALERTAIDKPLLAG
jgi:hypothetical protein